MAEASQEVEAVIDVSKLEPYISKEQVVELICTVRLAQRGFGQMSGIFSHESQLLTIGMVVSILHKETCWDITRIRTFSH
jgi:hypothetical protein